MIWWNNNQLILIIKPKSTLLFHTSPPALTCGWIAPLLFMSQQILVFGHASPDTDAIAGVMASCIISDTITFGTSMLNHVPWFVGQGQKNQAFFWIRIIFLTKHYRLYIVHVKYFKIKIMDLSNKKSRAHALVSLATQMVEAGAGTMINEIRIMQQGWEFSTPESNHKRGFDFYSLSVAVRDSISPAARKARGYSSPSPCLQIIFPIGNHSMPPLEVVRIWEEGNALVLETISLEYKLYIDDPRERSFIKKNRGCHS